MSEKQNPAIKPIMERLVEVGGQIFVIWLTEKNPEAKKQRETMEFFDKMLSGKLKDENDYQPYFDEALELLAAVKQLSEPES